MNTSHFCQSIRVVYFIFDGELGHNDAMQMVSQVGLHLVSKLRYNSALYFLYAGPYAGRGPRRKYGKKRDCSKDSGSCRSPARLV
jgi:DDE superfamily endonuclease